MKIALVCNEYPPARAGGIGTWTRAFAQALVRCGLEVWVIGVYKPNVYLLDKRVDEMDAGVHIIRLPASRLPKAKLRELDNRIRLTRELNRLHRTHGFDVVEIPDYQGYGAFYRQACPLVVRLHHLPKVWSDPNIALRSGLTRWFENRTLRRADQVVAVSHWAKDIALKHIPYLKNVAVNYYTLSEIFLQPLEQPIAREDNLIVFAGTLVAHKGIWELARAWEIVKRRFPLARLVMIGKDQTPDASLPSNRTALAEQLAGKDVSFVDHAAQADLKAWYYRATAACFPSKSETFGLVAAEAMACGAPVIYTQVGPGPEVAGNGSRALLVNPDDPNDIADALCRVLDEPRVFQARYAHARQWVQDHLSAAVTTSQSLELYRHLISARNTTL